MDRREENGESVREEGREKLSQEDKRREEENGREGRKQGRRSPQDTRRQLYL